VLIGTSRPPDMNDIKDRRRVSPVMPGVEIHGPRCWKGAALTGEVLSQAEPSARGISNFLGAPGAWPHPRPSRLRRNLGPAKLVAFGALVSLRC